MRRPLRRPSGYDRVTLPRLPPDAEISGRASDAPRAVTSADCSLKRGDVSSSRAISARRLLPLLLLAAAGALFMLLGGRHYLTFAGLAENSEWLRGLVARSSMAAALCFIAVYAGQTAVSVPGGAIITIAGGYLFGLWPGLLYVVTGATIGATAIFLAARAGLGDLARRGGARADHLKAGFRADAFNYLLVLRLIPVFPFWLVNLVAALAGMRLATYVLGTFLGIIPGSFVFVSLGTGMGDILAAGRPPDLGIVFRPSVLLPTVGLAVLALTPVLYKRRQAGHDRQPE
jgi:uncharacterized membrane protein YdjX (TVP38/TMEM64 family)